MLYHSLLRLGQGLVERKKMRGGSDPAVVKMAEQRRGRLDVENVERVIAGEGTAERTCCTTWKNG